MIRRFMTGIWFLAFSVLSLLGVVTPLYGVVLGIYSIVLGVVWMVPKHDEIAGTESEIQKQKTDDQDGDLGAFVG